MVLIGSGGTTCQCPFMFVSTKESQNVHGQCSQRLDPLKIMDGRGLYHSLVHLCDCNDGFHISIIINYK